MASSSSEQVQRLLLAIPYAARHPGVRLGVLAEKLGVPRERLRRDLAHLRFVGPPPFAPDDLLEVEIVRGQVFLRQAQPFTRPPRLTLREACAVWSNAQFALPLLRGALVRARDHLCAALAPHERGEFTRLCRQVSAPSSPIDELLAALAHALRDLDEVRFDELCAESDPESESGVDSPRAVPRVVEPWALRERRGRWCLDGFCRGGVGARSFFVDRLSALRLTGRRFRHRGQLAPPPPAPLVRLWVEAALAPWLADELEVQAAVAADESEDEDVASERAPKVTLEAQLDDRAAFVRLIASLGGRAVVLAPRALAEEVAAFARAVVVRHGGQGGGRG